MHRFWSSLVHGFLDPESASSARLILHRVVVALGLGLAVVLLLRAAQDLADGLVITAVALLLGAVASGLSVGVLARTRDLAAASWLLLSGGYVMLGTIVLTTRTLYETSHHFLPVLVLVAALLIGTRATLVTGLLNLILLGAMYALHLAGIKPTPDPYALSQYWFDAILLNVLVVVVCLGFAAVHRRALETVREQARALARENEERRLAEERATRAMEARTRFLAAISHELRTPLHGVVGAARLIDGQALSGEQRELLHTVNTSADLLLGLIDDVLDVARMDSDQLELVTETVDLPALLEAVATPLRVLAAPRGVGLTVVVEPDAPRHVTGDRTRLRQILVNLDGNAVKFTHEGEVTLELAGRPGAVVLTVSDTGIGMSPEQVATAFEPFVQASAETHRDYGGSGLGMAIVHRLVSLMEGQVSVESEPGVGTRVEVRLPLPAAAPDAPDEASLTPEAPSLRILIADDHVVNRMVAQRALERHGHEVQAVDDGAQAVAAVARRVPDLVLMDCQMPVLDGFEATRRIRDLPGGDGLPILALTASGLAETRDAARAAGMDAVLTKPLEPDALARAIRRWGAR